MIHGLLAFFALWWAVAFLRWAVGLLAPAKEDEQGGASGPRRWVPWLPRKAGRRRSILKDGFTGKKVDVDDEFLMSCRPKDVRSN